MAKQGGRVQVEQSDMCLALNMAKGGFSRAAMQEMQQLIKKPRTKVREAKKRSVVFPEHNKVKAAIERHPAMVHENQLDGGLSCQNATAKIPQTRWRRKGTGAPLQQPVPPQPRTPPAQSDDSERTQSSQTEGVPPRYVYIHPPLLSAQFFNLNPYAKDYMCNKNFIPDLLTDKGPSTG